MSSKKQNPVQIEFTPEFKRNVRRWRTIYLITAARRRPNSGDLPWGESPRHVAVACLTSE